MVRSIINYSSAGLIALSAAWLLYTGAMSEYYKRRPVEDIFQAEVKVPNFKVGTNPEILYFNEKIENFRASFDVELKDLEGVVVCRGESFSEYTYTKDDTLPDNITLNWFMDKDPITQSPSLCSYNLGEGTYYVKVEYYINQPNRPERKLTVTSNPFEVTSGG